MRLAAVADHEDAVEGHDRVALDESLAVGRKQLRELVCNEKRESRNY